MEQEVVINANDLVVLGALVAGLAGSVYFAIHIVRFRLGVRKTVRGIDRELEDMREIQDAVFQVAQGGAPESVIEEASDRINIRHAKEVRIKVIK